MGQRTVLVVLAAGVASCRGGGESNKLNDALETWAVR
jgi:hypothetical protein